MFLLTVILVIPGTREVHRFLGDTGLIVYAGGVLLALALFHKVIAKRFQTRISESQATWLAVFTVLTLFVMITVAFLISDSGRIGGGGDRHEALTVAVDELIRGRYPYTPEVYTGLPITPGPGAIFLAIPFVLIGNVAYQSVFWIGVAYLMFRSYFSDGRKALLLLWTLLALAPVVLQQLVTGSDLITNALYLLIFMWLFSADAEGSFDRRGRGLIASILLGIGLASRLNYLLLAPLIFAMVVRGKGWKQGIIYSLIAGATLAVITLPFYFYDKGGFSPLHVQQAASPRYPSMIINNFGFLPDNPAIVLSIPAILLASVLALRFQGSGFRSLMMNSAIVQFALLMPFFVLTTYQTHPLLFAFSDLGIAYMIFGALAIWPSLTRTSSVEHA